MLVILKTSYGWLGSQSVEEKLKDDRNRKEIIDIVMPKVIRMRAALRSGLGGGKVFEGSKKTIEDVIQKLTALLAATPGNNHRELITLVRTEGERLPDLGVIWRRIPEAGVVAPSLKKQLINLAKPVVVLQAYFIIMNEVTIHNNRHLLKEG